MDAAASASSSWPFRWDLVKPDHLGSLLDGCDEPDLWYLDDLTVCAGRILARAGGGQLFFVGRSLDSVFDLLSGALAGTSWTNQLHRLPFSFWHHTRHLSQVEISRAREHLSVAGLKPQSLARGRRPVAFVDVVYRAGTFTHLYQLLRSWVDEERAGWDVVRRKLRFIGVTSREQTSPKTWRWQQHADWTGDLPAYGVSNVSIPWPVWDYLGNNQTKLTRSFHPRLWTNDAGDSQRHDVETRRALAEAVALVAHGRTTPVRDRLVGTMAAEPAFKHAWLRNLALQIRRSAG